MKPLSPASHAALATFILCVATVAYTHHMPDFARFRSGTTDFLLRYTEARTVGTGHMYDIEAEYREQDRVAGTHIVESFPDRFPWQAVLMAPLARLPYHWAYWIWVGLNLAGFAALVLVWMLPHDLVLWGATFFPVAASLIWVWPASCGLPLSAGIRRRVCCSRCARRNRICSCWSRLRS
jgi:hypothetical protein